jgi:hypothetical protein
MTADSAATLAAVERELYSAFGLPAPAALAESRPPSVEAPVDPDEATAAAALATAASYFYVDSRSSPAGSPKER